MNGNEVAVVAKKIYFVPGTATSETAKDVLSAAYSTIGTFMAANKITMQGAPLTITTSNGDEPWAFNAGVPVDHNDVTPTGDIQSGTTYGGKAVQFIHLGPYEKLPDATKKAFGWLALQAYKPAGGLIAEYVNDPTTVPPEQIKTVLTIPVQ
jgi:effector-binding domain-containing protein